MRDLTEEQRRRLHKAYTYILSLRKKTTPTGAVTGTEAGVAGGEADEQQSLANSTRGRSTMQESEGRQ
jgi:hypothetical protein